MGIRAVSMPPADITKTNQLLFVGRGLNFQSTADQALSKVFTGTSYTVTDIVAKRVTGAASISCLGGVYTGAGKSGTTILSAVQSWIALAAGKVVSGLLANLNTSDLITATPLYLSLTTGSIAAVTADVFVYGTILD